MTIFVPMSFAVACPVVANLVVFGTNARWYALRAETGTLIGQVILTIWPFAVLYVASRMSHRVSFGALRAAWLGFAVTIAVWSWYAVEGFRAQTGYGTGGANIGLGILLIACVPLLSLAMPTLAYFQGRRTAGLGAL